MQEKKGDEETGGDSFKETVEKKIRRLHANFKLPRDTILRVLEDNNYDEDECILPLFQMHQDEIMHKKNVNYLKLLFDVPTDVLSARLRANNGDLDKTVEGLIEPQDESTINDLPKNVGDR
eukprot:TRINITY_DN7036_c0_g1_i1.p1 TRINITY_DN7036_c0_g1~~TRINITY_DN7036_c0_g1_i1.p1  ORF type:complete len:121 (-),score=25.51 TRINITY_DN7036_c0_g1_i1:119-481(-)